MSIGPTTLMGLSDMKQWVFDGIINEGDKYL